MLQPPEGYCVEDDCVMSNFDHTIDRNLEERLRQEKLALNYSGLCFHGEVWFEPEAGVFRCLISVHGTAREMVSRPTLDEIMETVCDEYGNE